MKNLENSKYLLLAFKYSKKILEWLCKKGLITDNDGLFNFVEAQQKQQEVDSSFFNANANLINPNGPTILPGRYSKYKLMNNIDLVCIHIRRPLPYDINFSYDKIYKGLSDNGITILIDGSRNAYCKSQDIPILLSKFSNFIEWLELPEGYRISKDYRQYYFDIIKYQISEIVRREYPRTTDFVSHYEGYVGFGLGHNPKKFIDMRFIFAYKPIYQEIEWDIDLVDQYKDLINWKTLIEKSNLEWNEDFIEKYYAYIPFTSNNKQFYRTKFDESCVINSYELFGRLSSNFLKKHKEEIEWDNFFEKGIFDLTPEELEYFYKYAKSIDLPLSENFPKTAAGSQISMSSLFKNTHFNWSSEHLRKALDLEPEEVMLLCVKKEQFNLMLRNIAGYEEIIEIYLSKLIQDCESEINRKRDNNDSWRLNDIEARIDEYKEFWLRFNNGGKVPNKAYKEYFTIDNIKRFHKEWELIHEEKFFGMNRTPDTNYHYYVAFNMWDRFANNKFVTLTYEHCLLLKDMKIRLGGSYVLEDGCYLGEDHRYPEYNALDVFSNHDFSSNDDIEKVIKDDVLLEYFMESPTIMNESIIKYVLNIGLDNIGLDEYISAVNKLRQ